MFVIKIKNTNLYLLQYSTNRAKFVDLNSTNTLFLSKQGAESRLKSYTKKWNIEYSLEKLSKKLTDLEIVEVKLTTVI